MRDGGHQRHSFPALKMLPIETARRLTTGQRSVFKQMHKKKARNAMNTLREQY